jgi:glycosyltransferase involved in cell wall biosynthesis
VATDEAEKRMTKQRICIVPKVRGVGGMVSFLHKFSTAVVKRGVEVTNDLADTPYDAVLVISGTREFLRLGQVKQRGVRVVQRLDGVNWIQRRRRTSLKYFFRAEVGNLLLALIRNFYADRVIYQSEFVRNWWSGWYGAVNKPAYVIHNGVDLSIYSPAGRGTRPTERYRLVVVEGSLAGGLSIGLDLAVDLGGQLAKNFSLPVELMVVGKVDQERQRAALGQASLPVEFLNVVPREQIPQIDRAAHLYFSAEINPPCPNAVIEALACGLPVVGFDTGALAELVTPNAGCIVPYGGNPWRLAPPDVAGLAAGAALVLKDWPRFSAGARQRAEAAFGLESMTDKYLEALLG